uniref:Transcription factor bHLH153-like n=1 Tax=Nelumbo nucifera TaxID=4432 RepID=A0A822Y2H8_NELNU|nr:TPA_asm: hypothetical protein HUJ06_026729 [Nelumbo nucifera]
MMTDYKRRPESVDEGSLTCSEAKRQKTDFSISPKTDTASVLLEAMEYIKFLHDQVQVLSAPYLRSTRKIQESEQYSLSSRGLCLVPISRTLSVVRSNGADIWAPIKASSPSSKMPRPNFIDMVSTGISRQA